MRFQHREQARSTFACERVAANNSSSRSRMTASAFRQVWTLERYGRSAWIWFSPLLTSWKPEWMSSGNRLPHSASDSPSRSELPGGRRGRETANRSRERNGSKTGGPPLRRRIVRQHHDNDLLPGGSQRLEHLDPDAPRQMNIDDADIRRSHMDGAPDVGRTRHSI